MLFTPAALLAIFASSVVASPISLSERDQKIIIGYRRVSKEQAADYKKNGNTLNYNPSKSTGDKQIGAGVYTSPSPGEWLMGKADDWWCVIMAESEQVHNTAAVWIPKSYYDFEKLWFADEDTLKAYIKEVDDGINPEKAFRMARMQGDENTLQMLIPPALLNKQGGGLGITVTCDPDVNKLPSHQVDYEEFEPSGDKDSETH
ncbi:hypothetical protein QIS74_05797 [Colletotrichum tabaci]|uniref:Uncharacterized protein n=1 Tax=Colletotrichum tabaci TaxID=1209068 RepID=A0AAV9TG12_9PEZI